MAELKVGPGSQTRFQAELSCVMRVPAAWILLSVFLAGAPTAWANVEVVEFDGRARRLDSERARVDVEGRFRAPRDVDDLRDTAIWLRSILDEDGDALIDLGGPLRLLPRSGAERDEAVYRARLGGGARIRIELEREEPESEGDRAEWEFEIRVARAAGASPAGCADGVRRVPLTTAFTLVDGGGHPLEVSARWFWRCGRRLRSLRPAPAPHPTLGSELAQVARSFVTWFEQPTIGASADFFTHQYAELVDFVTQQSQQQIASRRLLVRIEDPAGENASGTKPWALDTASAFASALARPLAGSGIELRALVSSEVPWSFGPSGASEMEKRLAWVAGMNQVLAGSGIQLGGLVVDCDCSANLQNQLLSDLEAVRSQYVADTFEIGMAFGAGEFTKASHHLKGDLAGFAPVDEIYIEVYNITTAAGGGDGALDPAAPKQTLYTENRNQPQAMFDGLRALLTAPFNNSQKLSIPPPLADDVYLLFSVEQIDSNDCIVPNSTNPVPGCGQINAFGTWDPAAFQSFVDTFQAQQHTLPPSGGPPLFAPPAADGSGFSVASANYGIFQYNFLQPPHQLPPFTNFVTQGIQPRYGLWDYRYRFKVPTDTTIPDLYTQHGADLAGSFTQEAHGLLCDGTVPLCNPLAYGPDSSPVNASFRTWWQKAADDFKSVCAHASGVTLVDALPKGALNTVADRVDFTQGATTFKEYYENTLGFGRGCILGVAFDVEPTVSQYQDPASYLEPIRQSLSVAGAAGMTLDVTVAYAWTRECLESGATDCFETTEQQCLGAGATTPISVVECLMMYAQSQRGVGQLRLLYMDYSNNEIGLTLQDAQTYGADVKLIDDMDAAGPVTGTFAEVDAFYRALFSARQPFVGSGLDSEVQLHSYERIGDPSRPPFW